MLRREENVPDAKDLNEGGLCKSARDSNGEPLNAILQIGEESKKSQEERREGKQELSRHSKSSQEIEVLTSCCTNV